MRRRSTYQVAPTCIPTSPVARLLPARNRQPLPQQIPRKPIPILTQHRLILARFGDRVAHARAELQLDRYPHRLQAAIELHRIGDGHAVVV